MKTRPLTLRSFERLRFGVLDVKSFLRNASFFFWSAYLISFYTFNNG